MSVQKTHFFLKHKATHYWNDLGFLFFMETRSNISKY
jgi:hypothetical protein